MVVGCKMYYFCSHYCSGVARLSVCITAYKQPPPLHPYIDSTTVLSDKEELSRTVVRELLPRATTHGHQTFLDYGRHTRSRSKGGDVREEDPAEECATKNLQTTVRHLGFTENIYGFHCTLLCCQYKRGAPTVVRELLPRT